jgi:hypothetical protein
LFSAGPPGPNGGSEGTVEQDDECGKRGFLGSREIEAGSTDESARQSAAEVDSSKQAALEDDRKINWLEL